MKSLRHSATIAIALALFTSCEPQKPIMKTSQPPSPTKGQWGANDRIRLSLSEDITSLDPRSVRSLNSINVIRMMNEGLMQISLDGKVEPALAAHVEMLPDNKTYLFTLRDAKWSNGDKITAKDFEYSWKSVVTPQSGAPYAYQFFVIKGAKDAFDGKAPVDDIGVRALSENQLQVTLEHPTSYFLNLVAFHPFFPVNESWTEAHKDFKEDGKPACLSSGPFSLESWSPNYEVCLTKNDQYWDETHVKPKKLQFLVLDPNTALNMYENRELDWAGSPTSTLPPDAIEALKKDGKLQIAPAAGTQFLRVNVERSPLNSEKMRRAFCLAMDRKAICDHIMQGNQTPATSFVPPVLGLKLNSFFSPQDMKEATSIFEDALQEMHLSREELPTITFCYAATERNQKIAQTLQQNFKEAFQIQVKLMPQEIKAFYEQLFKKEYDLALGSWFGDFSNPMSFLNAFQHKDNGTNNTNWQNAQYTALLAQATKETNPQKQCALYCEAQKILMTELPILPIFYFTFNYAKKSDLQNAYLSPLGYLELKEAYFAKEPIAEETSSSSDNNQEEAPPQ